MPVVTLGRRLWNWRWCPQGNWFEFFVLFIIMMICIILSILFECVIMRPCYGVNVCISPKFICWNPTPNVMMVLEGRDFGRWLSHESGALMNGISALIRRELRTSLVAQCLRIHLPMQGTWVRSLVQEDPTCHGATKPVHHNYWACALEPSSHNYWAHAPQLLIPCAATMEACAPRSCAPQERGSPRCN